MKTLYTILFTLVVFILQAQNNQLIDNSWQLQNVEINDVLVDAEIGLGDEYPFLGFEENDNIFYFIFDNLDGFLDLNETNQEFTITEGYLNFGDTHGTEAASLVINEFFLSDPQNYVFNNPFSYSFRTENEILYLDITNAKGDVATFYTTTLSNTSFEKVELSMYPNPATNLVHIQSSNAQILGVEIFNLQGRSILKPGANQLTKIDINPLAKGIYVVKVITTDGELVRKLVKK